MNPSSTISISGFWLKSLLLVIVCVFSFGAGPSLQAGEPVKEETVSSAPAQKVAPSEKAEVKEKGLPTASPVLAHIGPFPINSSMVLTWVVAIAVIGFAQYATRQIKEVPEGAQNFWEFLVEGLRDFLESIIGRALTKKTFWFFASIFIFILFTNWFGLIPGVGTVGWGHQTAEGFEVVKPLFRGANADLNMTLAMSLTFFACWFIWAIQSNGFGGFIMHIFGVKGDMPNPVMKFGMGIIFALVGVLEVVSILFRPVSLSFRLYGNIFAGENMLESMSKLVPMLAPIVPIPFYFMELLVGLAQALVFMLLTAVFTLLICSHADESHHGPETAHKH